MDTDKIVHILRNPWGRSAGDLRAAQLLAADEVERLRKRLSYAEAELWRRGVTGWWPDEPQPVPETPAPLRVRISSHHGSSSWYAGHEGEVFEVVDNGVSYYTLRDDYDRGHDHMWRHIPKYHCEVLRPEPPELGGSSQ